MDYVPLLGRILFSSIFIIKSFHHFTGQAMQHAMSRDMPFASALVPVAGILALLGGLSILLGYRAKLGAWLLIIFLIPTFAMHPFWNAQDFYSSMMEQYCFMKNISLMGACFMITYFGSGPLSMRK